MALEEANIPIAALQAYTPKFTMPVGWGKKPSDLYFKSNLLATDHVRHFASDVLGMIVILHCFLVERILPLGILGENITCFIYLYKIMCILRRGDIDIDIRNTLQDLCEKQNALFLKLYTDNKVKIKFHHVYHIAEDMFYLLSCLSCFPA